MTDYDDDKLKEENARKQRDLAQREIDDIRFVMDSKQGRRVVWSVLEKGRVFSAIPPMDALAMAGGRNICNNINNKNLFLKKESQFSSFSHLSAFLCPL